MIRYVDKDGNEEPPTQNSCGACSYSWYDKNTDRCFCDLKGVEIDDEAPMCRNGDGSSSVGALGAMQPNEATRSDMAYHGASMDNASYGD